MSPSENASTSSSPDTHSGSPPPSVASPAVVVLHPRDQVAIAVRALVAGQTVLVDGRTVPVTEAIAAGHKLAIRPIALGEPVFKYGQPIGKATAEIGAGRHVHSHNLGDDHEPLRHVAATFPPDSPTPLRRTFQGYLRPDGRVGTRNYVCLVSTVNCSATVCRLVAARFDAERMRRWPNVDGVFAATHTTGCALAYGSLKHQMLGRTLTGYSRHPNVGASLMVGLGCEQTTAAYLAEAHQVVPITTTDDRPLLRAGATPVMTMQQMGGTRATIAKAEKWVETLLDQADQATRTTVDASRLTLALECGGSDGYSGITANPAVGIVADRIVACGGKAVLSETTELYGAEHLLVERSRNVEVADRLLERIEWWKGHVAMYGGTIDNNPSIGNKAGGLTTITEKSLGAVSKSGSTALEAVYHYAEPIDRPGLGVMDSPGFDPASITGKVAGGANLVLFTTGRGSCYGCKPVPSIKIASNTALFERMREDMDLNAGEIAEGRSVAEVGDEFFEFALRVASGERTASEMLGIGDNEFVPWTVGPTL
ncbi:MAG: altronate dehydratase [Planctomycetaceae bacterium]|nr:MAG: altronate dehydratase [Planctomycetaceae bacterium]